MVIAYQNNILVLDMSTCKELIFKKIDIDSNFAKIVGLKVSPKEDLLMLYTSEPYTTVQYWSIDKLELQKNISFSLSQYSDIYFTSKRQVIECARYGTGFIYN